MGRTKRRGHSWRQRKKRKTSVDCRRSYKHRKAEYNVKYAERKKVVDRILLKRSKRNERSIRSISKHLDDEIEKKKEKARELDLRIMDLEIDNMDMDSNDGKPVTSAPANDTYDPNEENDEEYTLEEKVQYLDLMSRVSFRDIKHVIKTSLSLAGINREIKVPSISTMSLWAQTMPDKLVTVQAANVLHDASTATKAVTLHRDASTMSKGRSFEVLGVANRNTDTKKFESLMLPAHRLYSKTAECSANAIAKTIDAVDAAKNFIHQSAQPMMEQIKYQMHDGLASESVTSQLLNARYNVKNDDVICLAHGVNDIFSALNDFMSSIKTRNGAAHDLLYLNDKITKLLTEKKDYCFKKNMSFEEYLKQRNRNLTLMRIQSVHDQRAFQFLFNVTKLIDNLDVIQEYLNEYTPIHSNNKYISEIKRSIGDNYILFEGLFWVTWNQGFFKDAQKSINAQTAMNQGGQFYHLSTEKFIRFAQRKHLLPLYTAFSLMGLWDLSCLQQNTLLQGEQAKHDLWDLVEYGGDAFFRHVWIRAQIGVILAGYIADDELCNFKLQYLIIELYEMQHGQHDVSDRRFRYSDMSRMQTKVYQKVGHEDAAFLLNMVNEALWKSVPYFIKGAIAKNQQFREKPHLLESQDCPDTNDIAESQVMSVKSMDRKMGKKGHLHTVSGLAAFKRNNTVEHFRRLPQKDAAKYEKTKEYVADKSVNAMVRELKAENKKFKHKLYEYEQQKIEEMRRKQAEKDNYDDVPDFESYNAFQAYIDSHTKPTDLVKRFIRKTKEKYVGLNEKVKQLKVTKRRRNGHGSSYKTKRELLNTAKICFEIQQEQQASGGIDDAEQQPTQTRNLRELVLDAFKRPSKRSYFCLCYKKYDPNGSPMIGCDECNNWYHITCLKMTNAEFGRLSKEASLWCCPEC